MGESLMNRYVEFQEMENIQSLREEKEFRNRHNDSLTGIENMIKIVCDRCNCEESEENKISKISLSSYGLTKEFQDSRKNLRSNCIRDICNKCYVNIEVYFSMVLQ